MKTETMSIPSTGPAPESVTNSIHEFTKNISEYRICHDISLDLSKIGMTSFTTDIGVFTVEVIDCVQVCLVSMVILYISLINNNIHNHIVKAVLHVCLSSTVCLSAKCCISNLYVST